MSDLSEGLVVDCGSWQEAQGLSDTILEKGLALKVELVELRDHFSGDINKIRLIIESTETNKLIIQDLLDDLSKGYQWLKETTTKY